MPGDISHEDLGLKNSKLEKELRREVDVVVNSAATTNFDERSICIYIINQIFLVDFMEINTD